MCGSLSAFQTMRLLPATNFCALSLAGEWITAAMTILAFCDAVQAQKMLVYPGSILQLQLQYKLSFLLIFMKHLVIRAYDV
jgi:hypothetical protein